MMWIVSASGHTIATCPPAPYGVLSTSDSAYQPAYSTTTGWDFATGIGTVNAYNLVNNWPAGFTLTASPSSVTITQGGASGKSNITITPVNGFQRQCDAGRFRTADGCDGSVQSQSCHHQQYADLDGERYGCHGHGHGNDHRHLG